MSLLRTSPLSAAARWLIASVAVLLPLLAPVPAQAGLLVASAESCDQETFERPFLPWVDPANYVLAPGGDFSERAAGWELARAGVVAENEPYWVGVSRRPAALRLGAGGSATSPTMCVGTLHPTVRFFARNVGVPLATLKVEVLFQDSEGNVHALTIARVAGHATWQPTLPLPIVANLLTLLPDARTPIAFRFTSPAPMSAWLIDDLYVDPYRKG